ncbi:hypothetical protein L1887_04292 [Cichorium endivia]|nr:hypothetical protein L1887_04292 [Cichorium endivia]
MPKTTPITLHLTSTHPYLTVHTLVFLFASSCSSLYVSFSMRVASITEATKNQTTRPPFLSSEKDHGPITVNNSTRLKSRHISSRYPSPLPLSSPSHSSNSKSSSVPTPTPSRRSPSPLVSRNPITPAVKRSVSAERRRPTKPDHNLKPNNAGREVSAATKLLVTSTRNFSASFHGEAFSLPTSKTKVTPKKGNPERKWRFVNARTKDIMLKRENRTEKYLWNTWVTTSDLHDSVTKKRQRLQLLRQKLKLAFILKEQMGFLENWASLDKDHLRSLLGAIEAMKGSTLRLPVSNGAIADVESMKEAIISAMVVMQEMGSSICSLCLKAEEVNSLVTELENVYAKERALIRICKDFLSMLMALKVKDCSLRTHMLQKICV